MLLHAEGYGGLDLHPRIMLTFHQQRPGSLAEPIDFNPNNFAVFVASIFPTELLSTLDLLYTILAAPLPIPLSATDPRPPLSMPLQKDVTEEGVATALGEVLVYLIICIGSQSFIRVGISATVGPQMYV